jgi:hypothetical protein
MKDYEKQWLKIYIIGVSIIILLVISTIGLTYYLKLIGAIILVILFIILFPVFTIYYNRDVESDQ